MEAPYDKAITIIASEYRPCWVQGKKALFHRWDEIADLHIGGKALRTIDVDVPSGYIKYTLAIVEFEDGKIGRCYPHEVQFLDNKLGEYAFPERRNFEEE